MFLVSKLPVSMAEELGCHVLELGYEHFLTVSWNLENLHRRKNFIHSCHPANDECNCVVIFRKLRKVFFSFLLLT